MKPFDENELEQRIHRLVRDLPPRRAPASLESRVLAAIAARQALPWWHKSFAHWPLPIRAVFLVLTATLAAGTVWLLLRALGASSFDAVGETFAAPIVWWRNLQSAGQSLTELALRALPAGATPWIYAGLGVVAVGYAALIGAGAAVYRVLRPSS